MEVLSLLATAIVSLPVALGFIGIFGGIALGLVASAALIIFKAMSFFDESTTGEIDSKSQVHELSWNKVRVEKWYPEADWNWHNGHPTAV